MAPLLKVILAVPPLAPQVLSADGPAANAHVLHLGAEWSPWSPGPGELGANSVLDSLRLETACGEAREDPRVQSRP